MQMARANPLRELLQSVEKKTRRDEIGVVPEPCRRNADEVSPPAPAHAEYDRRDVHQRLKEMQPSNALVEHRGEGEDDDENTRAHEDQAAVHAEPSSHVNHNARMPRLVNGWRFHRPIRASFT